MRQANVGPANEDWLSRYDRKAEIITDRSADSHDMSGGWQRQSPLFIIGCQGK